MSAFSSSAFSTNAFSTSAYDFGTVIPDEITGRGKFTYVTPYQQLRQEEDQREKIKQQKTELDRLNSVLKESERKRALAAESLKLAAERKALQRVAELQKLENEYLTEINRLLMVRGELRRRIRNNEEILTVIIMAKKRRLRAGVNLQVKALA